MDSLPSARKNSEYYDTGNEKAGNEFGKEKEFPRLDDQLIREGSPADSVELINNFVNTTVSMEMPPSIKGAVLEGKNNGSHDGAETNLLDTNGDGKLDYSEMKRLKKFADDPSRLNEAINRISEQMRNGN